MDIVKEINRKWIKYLHVSIEYSDIDNSPIYVLRTKKPYICLSSSVVFEDNIKELIKDLSSVKKDYSYWDE